jgi:putative intracellular protease/amidase
MAGSLQSQKIAILATDGFEYVELVRPRKALDDAGAKTSLVSPKTGRVRGWNFTNWGDRRGRGLGRTHPGYCQRRCIPNQARGRNRAYQSTSMRP